MHILINYTFHQYHVHSKFLLIKLKKNNTKNNKISTGNKTKIFQIFLIKKLDLQQLCLLIIMIVIINNNS